MVQSTSACAVVAQPSGQSATVVLPRRSSCASLAMVYPPGRYARHHGEVCTWRSANPRDTPCRGDVSSAVLTASRAIDERRRLARAPSWCHFLGHVPSRYTYRGACRLGSAFAASSVTSTAVHHRGAMAVTHVPHSQNPGVPRPPAVRVIVWRDRTRDAGGTQPTGSAHSRAGPRSI